jgi:predicted small secreted protein
MHRLLAALGATRKRFLALEMHHFQSRFKRKEGEMMRLKHFLWALYLTCSLAGTLGSIACNTVRGMGQDIERGGEKTQDAANAVKRRM